MCNKANIQNFHIPIYHKMYDLVIFPFKGKENHFLEMLKNFLKM